MATWNLRVPFPPDADNNLSWDDRVNSVASAIAAWRPHLMALQEDCYFMSDSLMKSKTAIGKLSGAYDRYGLFNRNGESYPSSTWPENAFTGDGMRDGEHNSVWFDKKRFTALRNVTFWLSETPEVAGSSFGEITGRIANCVLLNDKFCTNNHDPDIHCTQTIFFCSTHFPSGNETRQIWSASVLSDTFSHFYKEFTNYGNNHLEMMVSGDFNSVPGSETYKAMNQAGFVDSRELSKEAKMIREYTETTNDWYGNENSLIDYVWLYTGSHAHHFKPSYNIRSVRHIPVPCCDFYENKTGMFNKTASDHLMVVVDIDFT